MSGFHGAPPELPAIVLLIDRDRDAIERLTRSFEDAGLCVAATRDPGEAVAAAEELKPDVIVADTDGSDIADTDDMIASIKLNPALERVPIIVMTSASGSAAPADAVLLKPVPGPLLLHRTREMLAQSGRFVLEAGRQAPRDATRLRRLLED